MVISNNYKFSIIIPVFRETAVINDLLNNIFKQFNRKEFEIIVVDGENNGNTINKISIESDKIKKVMSEKNRAKQMNAGVSVSEGEVLIFLHADCLLPKDALKQIKGFLAVDPQIVAGAFDLKIDSDKFIFKIISKLSSARSRITKIPYGDQAIFITKEFFYRIGGYKEIPIMEDVDLMRRIKRNKGKIHIFSTYVNASPRRWGKEGILYYTFKNWIITTLYFLGVSPDKLKMLYKDSSYG